MVALVGESGCGKTTTAQAVLRLVRPDAGAVHFDGIDVSALGAARAAAAAAPDADHLPGSRTSRSTRASGSRRPSPRRSSSTGRGRERSGGERVVEALELAGLSPPELYLDRFPHELSGGQRQRVAIAASLALGPELLVADEPVSMLDVSVRAGILTILDELRDRGLAVLMITHDLSTAARFADRICVMYLGRIVEEGPATQVIEDPAAPVHEGAALGRAATRPAAARAAADPPRRDAEPDRGAVGLPLPSALPRRRPECKTVDPELRAPAGAAAEGHRAACILAD